MFDSASLKGFRGFATEQKLTLAKPNGSLGSGLTVIVGPNSGGKSTIVEAFRKLTTRTTTSFTEGKRNKSADDKVEIKVTFSSGESASLETVEAGGSETEWKFSGADQTYPKVYVLPSRRVFSPYFAKGNWDRAFYIQNTGDFNFRGQAIDSFSHRLFNALAKKEEFNQLFWRVLNYELNWTIEQNDTGQYYIKVSKPKGVFHSSDGLGEGIVSLMFLVDALFESTEDEVIVFDEPELSLHPQLQRRFLKEILEYTQSRQVIYATHSPEMVSIESLLNGGMLARVTNFESESRIFQLSENGRNSLRKLTGDLFNPHILGYDARACFFEDDRLVLVEGQEDVIFMNLALKQLSINQEIRFFGYGAGGSGKIRHIAFILQELGYQKICCLYDGDKADEANVTRTEFPSYLVKVLNQDDIRDKYDSAGTLVKEGVFDKDRKIKDDCKAELANLIQEILDEIYINIAGCQQPNTSVEWTE